MLFDTNRTVFESEKERNLYAKYFAGYLLNELVEGYSERVANISDYLSEITGEKIGFHKPHVSFDNHAYLFGVEADRGEFADILLHDPENKTMVAIEAKFLSDWNADKDIGANLKRIELIKNKLSEYKICFVLLVSRTKWDAVKKMCNHRDSNYRKYLNEYREKVAIAFWEDLLKLCRNDDVVRYMENRLSLVNSAHNNRQFDHRRRLKISTTK